MTFATMQNKFTGEHIVGILGAAQIDIYGNLNSTVIGDYYEPAVRFSGSGGACDVASFVSRTIIFMKQEKRKFKIKLDYLTSPGSKQMFLKGYYPGITPDEILENMEFEIDISRAQEVLAPTSNELELLREKCDPQRLIL